MALHSVVLSPALDQSHTIARLLKRVDPALRLTGMIMPGEGRPFRRAPFDRIEPFSELEIAGSSRVVPTGARSTAFMLQRGDIALGCITMRREALRFYDKRWSIEAAAAAGVPVPKTWFKSDEISVFPVFFKSKEEGGGTRGIANRREEFPRFSDDLIFQEFISAPGTYGVSFIATEGVAQALHIHHEVESYPEIGGSAVVIERKADDRLLRYAESLLRHTNFSGWGLIEFKHCPLRDDYVFMELNAKFWASCDFAFRNEPAFARLLFDAEPPGPPLSRMVFMHRAFARGPRFVTTRLPTFIRGAELNFVSGEWQRSLLGLLLPRPAQVLLRSLRGR